MSYGYPLKDDLLALMQKQVQLEFNAFFEYFQVYNILMSQKINLPGLAKVFQKESKEELDHANQFICKLNERGHIFNFHEHAASSKNVLGRHEDYDTVDLSVFLCRFTENALKLERAVLDNMVLIKKESEKVEDFDIDSWIDPRIEHQIASLDEFLKLQTLFSGFKENRAGVYLLDKSYQ